MGCPSFVIIGNTLTFSIATHDPDTGVLTDADAAPAYRVYEDLTTTAIANGTMTLMVDAGGAGNTTGFYQATLTCDVATGYEDGKTYTVYIEATVGTDQGGITYAFAAYTGGLPADVQYVNSVELTGDGSATPWGPA